MDKYTLLLKRYLTAKHKCQDEYQLWSLSQKYPGIFFADQIWSDDNNKCSPKWELEARLLTAEPYKSIANKLKIDEETVRWYQRAFFNARPFLMHSSYVVQVIMGASINAGLSARDFDLLWKLVGYKFGHIGLDIFLQEYLRPAVSDSRSYKASMTEDLEDEQISKAWAALKTVSVSYNQNNILELYYQHKNIEKQGGITTDSTNNLLTNIAATVTAFPFHTGFDQLADSSLAHYDVQSVELRASDLLSTAMGHETPQAKASTEVKFPALEVPKPIT